MKKRSFSIFTLFSGLILASVNAQLDLNNDGLADLWQLRYSLTASTPDADPDGDGMSNAEEETAGTNPLDASSCFVVPLTLSPDGSTSTLSWNGVAGKLYTIENSTGLSNWNGATPSMISSGGPENMTLNNDQTAHFWRVSVRDTDTDSDGLTDAEERLLGFDPTDPNSAPPSTNGSGGDLTRALSLLTTNASFSVDGVTVTGTSPDAKEVQRFLTQAVIGASSAEVAALEQTSYEAWIDNQFTKSIGRISPEIAARNTAGLQVFLNHKRHAWWRQLLESNDILRQRTAFALSQIFVISDVAALNPYGMSTYYDLLLKNSFGNVRQLLEDITLHPSMGVYLSHLKNRKADPSINRFPDENYAREVMQLFTIGLFELNEDGTRKKDGEGNDIPTYDNEDITNFARIFTGISYGGPNNNSSTPDDFYWGEENFDSPMKIWEGEHDNQEKTLLNGVTLPAHVDEPGRTGMDDLRDTLDHLFNHANTGPFLSRLLIQRLVTSNPSSGYIRRVSQAFADDGNGVRGNMKAILKAILLDPEARKISNAPESGRLREPFVRYARLGRIFTARANDGSYQISDWEAASDLGQRWMSSPSVFNFYQPDHQPSGELAAAGLNGPEFQIMTAITAIRSQNFYHRILDGPTLNESHSPEDTKVKLQWDTELALTSNPTALIDHLNLLISAGQLSEFTKTLIRDQVVTIPANQQEQRLQLALRLIYISPDFAIFR